MKDIKKITRMKILFMVFVLLHVGEVATSERLRDVVHRLDTTIQGMEQSIFYMERTMFNMNRTISGQNRTIGALRNENNGLKSEISELKINNEKVTNLTSQKIDLYRGMTAEALTLVEVVSTEQRQVKTEVNSLKSKQRQVSSLQTQQGQQIASVKTEVNSLKSETQEKVYFSVYMSDHFTRPSSGVIIPFDKEFTDSGYNFYNNKFHCPVSGIYFFTFTLFSQVIGGNKDYQETEAMLVVDGTRKVEVFLHNSNTGGYAELQSSASTITYCSAGDSVWLKAMYGGGQIFGSELDRRTTFSGFLLK